MQGPSGRLVSFQTPAFVVVLLIAPFASVTLTTAPASGLPSSLKTTPESEPVVALLDLDAILALRLLERSDSFPAASRARTW